MVCKATIFKASCTIFILTLPKISHALQIFISTLLAITWKYTNQNYDFLIWPNPNLPNDIQGFQSTFPNLDCRYDFFEFQSSSGLKTCTSTSTSRIIERLYARKQPLPSKPTSMEEAMNNKKWTTIWTRFIEITHGFWSPYLKGNSHYIRDGC